VKHTVLVNYFKLSRV